MENKNLAVAIHACAYPDGRDIEQLMDLLCQGGRQGLKYDGKGTGVLNCTRISKHLSPGGLVLALDLEAAKCVHILRG